jgi:hypothetical protein
MRQSCPQPLDWVNEELAKIITQYREAYKFHELLKNHLKHIEAPAILACSLMQTFDVETAVCEQLTFLGRLLGFPRYQCKGLQKPRFAFGFCNPLTDICACPSCNECDVEPEQGFCFGYMGDVYDPFEFKCSDDELYRRFLLCRIIQRTKKFKKDALLQALMLLFDVTDPIIISSERGRVRVSINRPLTPFEKKAWHMYRAVLPVGLGVRVEILVQNDTNRPFGFGAGWGELCHSSFSTGQWL